MPDTIEATQLTDQGSSQVDKRLRREILSIGLREVLHLVEAHQQAAELGALTGRSMDLFVQMHDQLRRGEAVACRGAGPN